MLAGPETLLPAAISLAQAADRGLTSPEKRGEGSPYCNFSRKSWWQALQASSSLKATSAFALSPAEK